MLWRTFVVAHIAVGGKGCSYMNCCSHFSETVIKLSNFNLQGYGKEAALGFSNSKSEGWEKNWKYSFGEL